MNIERIEQSRKQEAEGRIWAKGSKFRIEMRAVTPDPGEEAATEKETVVFDGNAFWIYLEPKNELIILDLSKAVGLPDITRAQLEGMARELEETVYSFFSARYLTEPDIEVSEDEWEGRSFYVVHSGQIATWISKEDYFIRRITTHDDVGSVLSDAQLTAIVTNKTIPDTLFSLKVPDGVEPVDLVALINAMAEAFEEEESD